MWLTEINYSNRTETKLNILFEHRYEFLVLFLWGILFSPLYLVFEVLSHCCNRRGHSSLEHCVLYRAVNKSIRTTGAEIKLQLCKIFNTKKACLKRVGCVIQPKTRRPLAKFMILFQMLISSLNLFFAASSMVHLAILKLAAETRQAFWRILSVPVASAWEWLWSTFKSAVVRTD